MTNEVLAMIKETFNEIDEVMKELERNINRLYLEIWKDVLSEYKNTIKINKKSFQINICDYLDDEDDNNDYIYCELVKKMIDDGFKGVNNSTCVFTITAQQIRSFATQSESTEKPAKSR